MNEICSLGFYVLIAAIVRWFSRRAQKRDRGVWLVIPVLLLALAAGLRAESVGVDTRANIRAFWACYNEGYEFISQDYAYYALARALLRVIPDANFVLFVYALIIYACFFARLWDFREQMDLGIAGLLFVLLYFGGTLNGLRQFVAIAVVFYASRYLWEEKYLLFFLFAALACCFHRSALAAVLVPALYIGPRRACSRKQFLVITCTVLAALPVFVYLLRHYGSYQSHEGDVGRIKLVRLALCLGSNCVYCLACRLPARAGAEASLERRAAQPWFLLTLFGLCLGFGGAVVAAANRVGYYFRVFELIYYPMFLRSRHISGRIKAAFLALLAALGLYTLFFYNGIVPYVFFFQQSGRP